MKLKNILFIFTLCIAFTASAQENDTAKIEVARFVLVEEMPRYQGCENLNKEEAYQCTLKNIQEYIATFTYPAYYANISIEGKIYISFVVNKKSEITNVKLLRGIDEVMDEAAMDHIKKMPNFAKAGTQLGIPIDIKFNVPFTIKQ